MVWAHLSEIFFFICLWYYPYCRLIVMVSAWGIGLVCADALLYCQWKYVNTSRRIRKRKVHPYLLNNIYIIVHVWQHFLSDFNTVRLYKSTRYTIYIMISTYTLCCCGVVLHTILLLRKYTFSLCNMLCIVTMYAGLPGTASFCWHDIST